MIRAIGKPKPYCPHRVYLAGDMSGYGWREIVIDGLPKYKWDDYLVLKTDCFDYVGPFFELVTDDKQRQSLPDSHKQTATPFRPARLLDRVKERVDLGIQHCNVLLAYVEQQAAFETILEIDAALAMEKNVVVCFAPDVDHTSYEEYLAGANYFTSVTPDRIDGILLIETILSLERGAS